MTAAEGLYGNVYTLVTIYMISGKSRVLPAQYRNTGIRATLPRKQDYKHSTPGATELFRPSKATFTQMEGTQPTSYGNTTLFSINSSILVWDKQDGWKRYLRKYLPLLGISSSIIS